MKRLVFLILIVLLCNDTSVFGKDNYHKYDYYGRKHYRIAAHITSPLGLMTKYGGGLEFRKKNVSYLVTYIKYMGAYPGRQINMELEFYLRTAKKHQSYIWFKGLAGDAGYDGEKISMFGYPTNIKIDNLAYIGAGTGYGRRWNFNSLFITFSAGLKFCAVATGDLIEEDRFKNMYTLFHYTGPGAYADVHFQFGFQL